MQFTYEHFIGEKFHRFHANFKGIKPSGLTSLKESFAKIGGIEDEEKAWWYFPLYVSSKTISDIIYNTCFVCGGLMKDSTAFKNQDIIEIPNGLSMTSHVYSNAGEAKQIKVRKCASCGHSHT